MPDELITETTKELLSSGGPWAAIIIFMGIVLWYVDRRATNERREFQTAVNQAKADHLADVKRMNDQFDPVKDQLAAIVMQGKSIDGRLDNIQELIRERRK